MFKPQSLPDDDPWGAPSHTSTGPTKTNTTVTAGILGSPSQNVGSTSGLHSATSGPTNNTKGLHHTVSALSDHEPDDLRAALSRNPPARNNTWGDFGAALPNDDGGFGASAGTAINGGFGSARPHIRSAVSPGGTVNGAEETVNIQVLPEKEGVFMFQHRNYQVTSVRKNVRVVRRYSDFVW
jgi:sorting nexin-8